jgi:hypothetical protein
LRYWYAAVPFHGVVGRCSPAFGVTPSTSPPSQDLLGSATADFRQLGCGSEVQCAGDFSI